MYECNEILSKIHNGYWIYGVLRTGHIINHKFVPVWKYTSYKSNHPIVLDSSLEGLLTKMKIKGIPCKVLTYDEYTLKMKKSSFIYHPKNGFRRDSGGRYLQLSLDDAKKIINMIENGKSFQHIYNKFLKKSVSGSVDDNDVNIQSVMTFVVAYMDGLVRMPDEANVEQTSFGEKNTSEFDEVNREMGTVTSTMTVDLTKKDNLDTVNHNDLEDRISCLESKIDYLYENCVVENKNKVCEEKSWWKKIIQR